MNILEFILLAFVLISLTVFLFLEGYREKKRRDVFVQREKERTEALITIAKCLQQLTIEK